MGFHSKPTPTIPLGYAEDAAGNPVASGIPGVATASRGTASLGAGNLYYCPWLLQRAVAIDQIAVGVATGHASLLRLGIYRADLRWQPTALVIDAGTVDATAVGPKVITLVPDLLLPPGRYLFAVASQGAPWLRSLRGGSDLIGYNDAEDSSSFIQEIYVPFVFGVLPDPGLEWTNVTYGSFPFNSIVRVRVSDPDP